MEKSCSIAGIGTAADVTGMRRICTDLLSRVDDFVHRLDVIHSNIADARECSQHIAKVLHMSGSHHCSSLSVCYIHTVVMTVSLVQEILLPNGTKNAKSAKTVKKLSFIHWH